MPSTAPTARAPQPSGMTLVEMLVTLVVMSIVMAGTMQSVIALQAVHLKTNYQRQASSNGRTGLTALERDLRMAGYGMDPSMAFDFSVYRGFPADPDPLDGTPTPTAPFAPNCTPTGGPANDCLALRDRMDGPDEIVFYARNPGYWGVNVGGPPEGRAWQLAGSSATTLTFQGHGGDRIGRGQILQVVCQGAGTLTYVTVSATAPIPAVAGAMTVSLAPAVAGDPFRQNGLLGIGCLNGTSARVFAIDRFRYHIREGRLLAPNTTVPFLALDQGVDLNHDGVLNELDITYVAPGVADLQVGYFRPTSPGVIDEVGNAASLNLACFFPSAAPASWKLKNELPATCAGGLRVLDLALIGAQRYNDYSYGVASTSLPIRNDPGLANLQSVHVSLVSRSLKRMAGARELRPVRLNRGPAPTVTEEFHYSVLDAVVPVPNLRSRSLSYL